jgi:GT2 family glycosyltransferase
LAFESLIPKTDLILTCRDRVEDLMITLDKCLSQGFNQHQIHIIDDGSIDDTFNKISSLYPDVSISRNEISLGYIVNRNTLMNSTTRDFILSLSADDLEEALSIIKNSDSIGIFSFNPIERKILNVRKEDFSDELIQIRSYIGCGHIIKRKLINKIGLYNKIFEFYCEELDYSIRAFKEGYKVVSKRNLLVHHRVDFTLRNKNKIKKEVYKFKRRSMLGFSNNLLVTHLYYPFGLDFLFIIYYSFRRFWFFTLKKGDWYGTITGFGRYLILIPYIIRNKKSLGYKKFRYWYRLPGY